MTTLRLSNKDRHFLSIAIKVAANSECRIKHGAVFVKNGNVLAIGVNKNRNHPSILGPFRQNSASYHAEIVAGSRVSRENLRGCIVYVARILRNGYPGLSKPCDNCQEVLDGWGIKRVVYTQSEQYALV